jgi:hypothetical protein
VHFGGVNEKIDVGCEGFLAEKELFAGSWSGFRSAIFFFSHLFGFQPLAGNHR